MPETIESLTLLQQLRAKRTESLNEIAALVENRGETREAFEKRELSEDAKPSDEERSAHVVAEEEFGKEFSRREAEIHVLDQRIREQELIEQRRQDAANASKGSVSVKSEPGTYRKDNADKVSYFRDLAIAQVPSLASRMDDPHGAIERLQRHAQELNSELPKREQAREQRAEAQVDRAEREFTGSLRGVNARGLNESPFERRVNPNRTDGQGGFVMVAAA